MRGRVISAKLGKTTVLRGFLRMSLCAKFHRFFIILGGVRFPQETRKLAKLAKGGKKTRFLLKIRFFLLHAKFNRFFIILGGGR